MTPEQAGERPLGREAIDRNERRHVVTAVMPYHEAASFGAQPGEDPEP